jgi:hypothetical protein
VCSRARARGRTHSPHSCICAIRDSRAEVLKMISCRQSRTSAPRRTRWIRTAEVWYAHGKIGGALKAPSCLSARSRGTGEPLPRGSCNRGGSSRRQWTTRGSSPARAHRPRPPNHHSASDSLSARSARFTPWAQLTPRPRLHLRHHSRQGEGILPARGQTLRTHADYSYKFDHIVQKYQKPTADAALTPHLAGPSPRQPGTQSGVRSYH